MNPRHVVRIALLAVVALTLAMLFRPRAESVMTGANDETSRYTAYYFHGDIRCDTCRSIEAQAEAAVRAGFADQLAAGTLRWLAVNTDLPENTHFTGDFGLTHSTLVLVENEGARTRRFVALDRVWELVYDEEEFRTYVVDELGAWMQTGS